MIRTRIYDPFKIFFSAAEPYENFYLLINRLLITLYFYTFISFFKKPNIVLQISFDGRSQTK